MQRRLIGEGNTVCREIFTHFVFTPCPHCHRAKITLYTVHVLWKCLLKFCNGIPCTYFVGFFFFLDPPSQPSVTEVMITPTTADFIVRFSSVSNAPPPKRLKVTVTPSPTERIQYFTVGMCHLQYLINETNPFCNQGNWLSKKKEKNVRVKVYHTCYYATL